MRRFLPILAGLLVLIGTGVVHGLWTERWHRSPELQQAASRLDTLPADLGPWKGEVTEQDPEALAQTGAVGHYSRLFTDPQSGEKILVILLCGRPGRMSVHRPEHCYGSAGYEMTGPPLQLKVTPKGQETAELWTGLFSKNEAGGPVQLRIFWSWFDGRRWQAPNTPRTTFARLPALYKLYVIRNVTGSHSPIERDPSVALLGWLLPELDRTLATGD